ncbi:MAG TPA: hypothetical protein VGD64_02710 [Acidisarcina sp.]
MRHTAAAWQVIERVESEARDKEAMFVSAIPNDVAGQPIPGGEFAADHAAAALHDLRASLRAGDIHAADAALTLLQTQAGADATAQVDNDLQALASALGLSNFERAASAATLLQHDLANSPSATASPLTIPLDVVTLDATAQLASSNDTTNSIPNPQASPASVVNVANIVAFAAPLPVPVTAPIPAPSNPSMDASAIAMEIASSLAASFTATYVANVAEAEEEDRIEYNNEPEPVDETVAAVPESAKLDLTA